MTDENKVGQQGTEQATILQDVVIIPKRPTQCLFYDGPAYIFFNNCTEVAEHVIRVVLDRTDLHVISSKGQHVVSKLDSHDIRCDVLAKDDKGTSYDIEIQQVSRTDLLKRADYYGAMLKVDALKKAKTYEQNREVYIIFIIKAGNAWCNGKHVRSFYMCDDDKNDVHTGTRIYFVNGELIDDSKVGKLMQSFHCENADEMQDPIVAKRYREIKDTLDQEDEMDDYDRMIYNLGEARGEAKGIEIGEARIVQNMLRMSKTISETANLLGLSEETVHKYATMKLD